MKKIFVFGSEQCPDCLVLKDFLEANQVRFTFIDILNSLGKLKMFLKYRDSLPIFEAIQQKGSIGIPFLVVDDGAWVSLEGPSEPMLERLKG
jgi:glutaredoxin-related protein